MFADDGYSGVNFERPTFRRMLHLIEDGKIGVIITKDLSRLGRNYIEVGSYTEIYFPKNNVRYIAVNEFPLLSARSIQKLHSQVGLHSRSVYH